MQAAPAGAAFFCFIPLTRPDHVMPRRLRSTLPPAAAVALLLAACATTTPPPLADGWHAVPLPGKRSTQYSWGEKDGRPAWRAEADRSASLWRRAWPTSADGVGVVRFSWWVPGPLAGADLAVTGRGDSPARVLFAFDGDHARLSLRNRMLFDLAETISGERPPYATLMYAYANVPAHVGQVLVHPRSDRVRTLVLDAGTADAGRWRDHRRDLAADFRRAFGEPPGPLISVALLTDGDNTSQRAQAWYGPVAMEAPAD